MRDDWWHGWSEHTDRIADGQARARALPVNDVARYVEPDALVIPDPDVVWVGLVGDNGDIVMVITREDTHRSSGVRSTTR
jgi:hypothetical protein